jgi:hypothetical protein
MVRVHQVVPASLEVARRAAAREQPVEGKEQIGYADPYQAINEADGRASALLST